MKMKIILNVCAVVMSTCAIRTLSFLLRYNSFLLSMHHFSLVVEFVHIGNCALPCSTIEGLLSKRVLKRFQVEIEFTTAIYDPSVICASCVVEGCLIA